MPLAIAAACLTIVALLIYVLRSGLRGSAVPPSFQLLVTQHLANQQVLDGLRVTEHSLQLPTCDVIRNVTAADLKRFRDSVGQLYAPQEELFPVLATPLQVPCLYWLSSSLALIHPTTGTLFGIRVGTYLCLLRLPTTVREYAITAGHAWAKHPHPNFQKVDIPVTFGTEWVMPNGTSAEKDTLYQSAFEYAGSLHEAN